MQRRQKKVMFLLCVPRTLYDEGRFYFYKMNDYQILQNLKHDLPHQSASLETHFHSTHVMFWDDAASTIMRMARESGHLMTEELNALKEFYNDRLVGFSVDPQEPIDGK